MTVGVAGAGAGITSAAFGVVTGVSAFTALDVTLTDARYTGAERVGTVGVKERLAREP